MSAPDQAKPQLSPLAGALSISSSLFVAFTSLFVAVLAFVAAANQMDTVGLTGGERAPDETARWLAYGVGAVALMNGFVAGARARKNPRIAVVTSTLFVITAAVTGWLFVKAW